MRRLTRWTDPPRVARAGCWPLAALGLVALLGSADLPAGSRADEAQADSDSPASVSGALASAPGVEPTATAQSPPADPAQREFFERQVRPLLAERCWKCHGAAEQKGGLRLDSGPALLAGGDTGPALVPGHVDDSLLVAAVRYDPDGYQMPPDGKLPAEAVAALERWVSEGAYWPSDHAPAAAATDSAPVDVVAARRGHWSFQPLATVAPPEVRDAAWPANEVDRFILARLEAADLAPAPPADRGALLRRVTYDLTGLPPTRSEIADFLADDRPDAWSRVVERLLASPHYGERWARHWLDLVRYAETAGHEFDFDLPDAWRYRDYCVRAFNADLPYFTLVREHLAGDLIDPPRRHPADGSNESLIGTAFFFLGESKHSPVDLAIDRVERFDNQIDVLSKTFLGLTLSCARCHDHKFDPLSQRDYYALAGILKSSRYTRQAINPPQPRAEVLAGFRQTQERARACLSPQQPGAPAAVAAHRAPPPSDAQVVADFDDASWQGWTAAGPAFAEPPLTAPQPRLTVPTADLAPWDWTYPGTADSGALADVLEGTLRSPSFTLTAPRLWYRVRGERVKIRLILEHFQRIQYPIYGQLEFAVNSGEDWTWHSQDVSLWQGMRGYIEVLDEGPGWAALDGVWQASGEPPAQAAPPPAPLVATERAGEVPALAAELRRLADAWPRPDFVMAFSEGTAENERLHVRGNPHRLADEVARRGPEVLGGLAAADATAGSGRWELAELIAGGPHPLAARVIVNRVWHHHFGAGLVRSPDDFGTMGQPPTHPELLDWLAARLVAEGGSLKALHRLLVHSRTYQLASQPSPQARQADGDNKLWSHANVRRLEAEAIRDTLLAVAGRLDPTLGGPPVPPHLTPFMQGRGRPPESGPLDGAGRRTLYLGVRRNFLNPLLLAFDYPQPFSTMGRRSVSNVPAQGLVMMNNPLVHELATAWANRVLAEPATPPKRIERMYLDALGRSPTPAESAAAASFLEATATPGPTTTPPGATPNAPSGTPPPASPADPPPAAWQALALAIFNLKELVYVP